MINDQNNVVLRGNVISFNSTRKFATVRLAVESEKGKTNFPLVNIYNTNLVKDIQISKRFLIQGHTQNRPVTNAKGKKETKTIIVADNIIPAARRLYDYLNPSLIEGSDGGAPADINNIVMIGTVRSTYTPPKGKGSVCLLRIDMVNENTTRQCDISCFGIQAEYVTMLEPGQKVAVVGYVSTNKKINGKETLYFQNVICRDVSLIKAN